MLRRHNSARFGLATLCLLTLAACGGGGGGGGGGFFLPSTGTTGTTGTTTTPTPTPTTTTPTSASLSGVAATGAAFAGASITVTDQTGATVCTTRTNDDGTYHCDLPAGTKAPLVIRAQRDDLTLYSTTASTGSATANITPLTTIIVSRLSPDGDPASLAGAIQTRPETVSDTTVKAQVAELVAALKPLLDALGDTLDPISGAFSANGSGHDRVLDSINVSVRPDGAGANIEVTVKTVPGTEDAAPVTLNFRSNDSSIPASLPPIAAESLVPNNTAQLIAEFIQRLNACYAVPLSQRVSGATDNAPAIGDASALVAPACRTLFVNDNPADFLNGGARVSNTGAFSGFYRPGATGLVNDRAAFDYFRANGDMQVSYRWTDTVGNTDFESAILRNQGGVLKLAGNQFRYNARVAPYVADRDFVHTPDDSYYSTGYNVNISNRGAVSGGGFTRFEKVVVTTPFGVNVVFKPQMNIASLVAVKPDTTVTGSPVLRLASAFRNTARTDDLAALEPQLYYMEPRYTDEQLRAIPDQSVWTIEFFHNDGQPNEIQTYRTTSRAATLAEARKQVYADLTPALRTELRAELSGPIVFGAPSAGPDANRVDVSAAGDTDGWMVPEGALAPTGVIAYGRVSPGGDRYTLGKTVRNTLRKTVIECPAGGSYCDNSTGVNQFAEGVSITSIELWARTQRQLEVSKMLAFYTLAPL